MCQENRLSGGGRPPPCGRCQLPDAGLDVLEFERPDLSGLDREAGGETLDHLLRHERVLITPHVAGVTHEGKEKMAAVLADKILNAFPDGTP